MKIFSKSCKILSLVLTFCMVCTFLPIVSFAEEENTTIFEITVNDDGETCTVTGFKEESIPEDGSDLVIPDTVAGYTVTAIGDNAFYKIDLGSVTLPDTVKSIGASAFYQTGPTITAWPAALETIGDSAFHNGGSLKMSLPGTLPAKLKTIGKNAFQFASLSSNIVLNDGLETIGEGAFWWTSKVVNLIIPDSVTSVGKNAATLTNGSLKSIRFPKNSSFTAIPEGVISAGNYTTKTSRLFGNLSIYIPANVTSIPDDFLKDFNDGAIVTIYGEDGSAAYDYYKKINALLEAGKYTNDVDSSSYTDEDGNYTDADKDGKGEIAAVNWVEYDFVNDMAVSYDDSDIYNGSNTLSAFAEGTNCPSPATVTQVEGVYGKTAEDMVYKIAAKLGHSGYNFIGGKGGTLDTTAYEIAIAPSADAPEIIFSAAAYTSAVASDNITVDGTSVSNRISGTLLSIKDGSVNIGSSSDLIAASDRGKTLCNISNEQWISIAVVIPGYNQLGKATDKVYVYVNGTEYEVTLVTSAYGTRHTRLSPNLSSSNESTKTFYVDNFRTYAYSTESYTSTKDALPVVDFGSVDVLSNTVNIEEGTTVAEFEAMIDTSANVRVYSDSTYKTLLTDDDEIPYGAVIVFATNNRRTTERTYSYYSYSEVTYTESGLYDGTNSFTLSSPDTSIPTTVTTNTAGVYGKAADDVVYKMDTYGGSGGKNYIGIQPTNLEYETMEISFAMSENAPTMIFSGGFYTSDAATDYLSGTILTITDSAVITGSAALIASASQNKKLCDIEPGQWYTIAVVIPGYNQTGTSTSSFYIYVNGTEYELALATPTYGTRHLRFSPSSTYTTEKTIYLDNYRTYKGGSEYYTKAKDALPVVDMSEVDVLDGNINLPAGTTVSDFKEMISTKATVRVFNNDSYSTLLEDSDVMSAGNMVVFATNNKRTTERTYSYYTVNRPLFVQRINVVNADGKTIKGTSADIKNIGEDYYLDTTVTNKATAATATLNAIVASYDADGKMIDFVSNTVTVAPGTTQISPSENAVKFEGLDVKEGYTMKAFLWVDESNEPMCEEFEAVFNGKEEYHIIAFSNSYGNDAFSYLPEIASADGIDIYAVNMYTGGCTLEKHYNYMNGIGTYESRIEYTPDGSITTKNVSFDDGLHTYGYSWDYITLQSRSVQSYNFDYFYTDATPYITALADYLKEESPKSEVMFYQTWALDIETAKTSDATSALVAGLSDDQIRPTLFSTLKANYLKAAEMIGNPNRMVPVGEAVNYALDTLGIPEYEKDADGNYVSSGRGMYRDTTCHLAIPYGRVLAGLTWYEYITGNDARDNAYTNAGIPEEDMKLLKEAAHYACSRDEYNPN